MLVTKDLHKSCAYTKCTNTHYYKDGGLLVLVISLTGQKVNLTLTSSDELEGEICPDVQMKCRVEDIANLRWFFDGVQGAIYIHDRNYTFPPPRELQSFPGVRIVVTNAVQGSTLDFINANSTLTANVSSLQQFSGQIIQCGTLESEGILIGNVSVLGKELVK